MGMYDILVGSRGESQVKCFYIPIYKAVPIWPNEYVKTSHSGGLLRVFKSGDEIPWKTEYYEYPSCFAVDIYNDFAPSDPDNFELALFDNYKFVDLYHLDDDIDPKFFENVYSYYGDRLRVSNLEKLKQYYWNLRLEYDKPVGFRHFRVFYQRWRYPLLKEFYIGELFFCLAYQFLLYRASPDPIVPRMKSPLERMQLIKADIRRFSVDHPEIYEAYVVEHGLSDWEEAYK